MRFYFSNFYAWNKRGCNNLPNSIIVKYLLMVKDIHTKKIILLIFALLLISPKIILSQAFPDYPERNLITTNDSLRNVQAGNIISNGSVDPAEYIVGPGDKLFISISGVQDISLNLPINQDSELFIPKVGSINLKNLNLNEAKNKIKNTIEKYFKNVDIYISLASIKKIKVSLLGDVRKPATYLISGNFRLLDVLNHSYGVNSSANLRDIKITDKDGKSNKFDFLEFSRLGDSKGNPLLHDGDIVDIDKADEVISIHGQVKYPGTYEFVPGETITHFINIAGGFLSKAKTDSIEIVSFTTDGKTEKSVFYSYQELQDKKIELSRSVKVMVREIPEYLIDRLVNVQGWVKYPGYYKIIKEKQL